MGHWKRDFTEQECMLLVAEALNQCTYHYYEEFDVTGYLLTGRRLFLVLDKNGPSLQDLLNRFYDQLQKDIQAFQQKAMPMHHDVKKERHSVDQPWQLFTAHAFINPNLFKLITGQKVVEHYYDPHLERMKDYIHNYNFCSALDYEGGISPVIVKLLHHQK